MTLSIVYLRERTGKIIILNRTPIVAKEAEMKLYPSEYTPGVAE